MTNTQTLEHNRAIIAESQAPINRWYAGEGLGHEPTESEALLWYIEHGGPEHFAQTHQPNHP